MFVQSAGRLEQAPFLMAPQNMSCKDLNSLDVFEGATAHEIDTIQKLTLSPKNLTLSQWIKQGDWTFVVNDLIKIENGHLYLLATYALGQITPNELITAFIFLNGAVEAIDGRWEIKKSVEFADDADIPDNLKYAIFYSTHPDNLFDEGIGTCMTDHHGVGSFPIILKKNQKPGPLVPTPIYGMSHRGGMLDRWERSLSDIALIAPGTTISVHNLKYNLLRNIQHDLVHGSQRTSLGDVSASCRKYSRFLENCQKKLPPIKAQMIQMNNYYIHQDSSFEDQVHYLFYSLSGRIIDTLSPLVTTIIRQFPDITIESMTQLLELELKLLEYALDAEDRNLPRVYLPSFLLHEGVLEKCVNIIKTHLSG